MTVLAFALVGTSAVMHATWNLLAKRVGGGMAAIWLYSTLATVIYLPFAVAILVTQQPTLGLRELLFLGGSILLHIAYYFLLQRGYKAGDLSLVYPLARGTGPMLSVIGAILLLKETPALGALAGAALVSAGVFILLGSPTALRQGDNRAAIAYGLLCGLSIAAYTLWDKQAVSALLIPPLFLTWAGNLAQAVVLAPAAYRERATLRAAWRDHRRAILGISTLDSLSYILFLIALSVGSVSLLAPLRQTSILIGTFMGVRLLSEDASRRRLIAAVVMLSGLVALALG
ncbi:MAG: EamA family transporter [Anaerolineae bacterium]|nr:EamA family transporter [Anaerolineae bacterium]